MTTSRCLVTGATGLLGSHLVEQLVARGDRVRALVRPGSDRAFLAALGVEFAEGDLNAPATLPRVVDGVDTVYHCAARIGDWAPQQEFQQAIVDATTGLLTACRQVGIGRLLHVSSIAVYGHPHLREGQWIGEDAPLGMHLRWGDHYCRAKIAAERVVRESGVPWTIVRPSWIYGPRDRNSLPRIIKSIRAGRTALVGSGDNLLNILSAQDVADGVLRATASVGGLRRAYNLGSEGDITQREFLDLLTDGLGLPRIRRRFPYRVAWWGGFLAELVGYMIRLRRPPHFTRYGVALMGRSTRFSIDRARQELGWQVRVRPQEGLRQALGWYLSHASRRSGFPA